MPTKNQSKARQTQAGEIDPSPHHLHSRPATPPQQRVERSSRCWPSSTRCSAKVRAEIRRQRLHHPMFIGGKERQTNGQSAKTTPMSTRSPSATSKGTAQDANDAVAAAKAAFPAWSVSAWKRRCPQHMRKVAGSIEKRLSDIAALGEALKWARAVPRRSAM